MVYQTFGDQRGDSNSPEKLTRLRLPEQLNDKSFLDVGCNEGFFCIAAHERGAAKVVGIDSNHDAIDKARKRAPFVEFIAQSWDSLPGGTYDVILLASALHYAKDPRSLLSNIAAHLSHDGLFILEAGMVGDGEFGEKSWSEVRRGLGTVWFPNRSLLIEDLLSNFAVRIIGSSVNQSGDPVPRFVFHCRRYRPIVLLCPGKSGAGKSTLALEFRRNSIPTFSTDAALMALSTSRFEPVSLLHGFIREHFNAERIGTLVDDLVRLGMGTELADTLFHMFPTGRRMAIIEGYAILPQEVHQRIAKLLSVDHKVWSISPEP